MSNDENDVYADTLIALVLELDDAYTRAKYEDIAYYAATESLTDLHREIFAAIRDGRPERLREYLEDRDGFDADDVNGDPSGLDLPF